MKKPLLLIPFLFAPLFAQQKTPVSSVQPDCMVFLPPTSGTGVVTATRISNAQVGCDTWTLFVSTINFAGGDTASVRLESALNGVNATTPGTFGAFTGTITTGANPITLGPGASKGILFAGATGDGAVPWVQLDITAFSSASGTVTGILYGFKNPASGTSSGSSGCVGTSVTPCVVDGPTPAGSAPTFPPVMVSGQTGTVAGPGTIRTLRTDDRGDALVVVDGNPTVLSDQQAVTASAVALATNTAKNICVVAPTTNQITVYVGPSGITTATGFPLAPGAGVCVPVTNTNLLFVIASTTGASVGWIGTNAN
jgi:hypothetical protein